MFKVPEECYEKFEQKTVYGFRTWYEFKYTGECFRSKYALALAYRDYMRQNCDADFYYDDLGFYKQHELELCYGGVK